MATSSPGRKTKLTPQLQQKLIDALRLGLSIQGACQLVNLDDATYYRWIERGQREISGIYCEFCEALKQAEAECEMALIEKVSQATDWRSAAWSLERRFPDRWGDRVRELQRQMSEKNKQIDILLRVLTRILSEPTEGQDAITLKTYCSFAIDELRLSAGLPLEDIQRLLADIKQHAHPSSSPPV